MTKQAPKDAIRCTEHAKTSAGREGARCMRRAIERGMCRQHLAMLNQCCGGNDGDPVEHTFDCPLGRITHTQIPWDDR